MTAIITLYDETATTAVEVRPGITLHVKTLRNADRMSLVHSAKTLGEELRGEAYDGYMDLIGGCIQSIEGCDDEVQRSGGMGPFLARIKDHTLQQAIAGAVMDLCTIPRGPEKN